MDIQASTRYQELQESGGGPQPTFSCQCSPAGLSLHEQSCPALGCSAPTQCFGFADCNPTPLRKKKEKKIQPKIPNDFRGTVKRVLSALLDRGQSLQHLAVWSPVACPSLFIKPLLPAKLRASPDFIHAWIQPCVYWGSICWRNRTDSNYLSLNLAGLQKLRQLLKKAHCIHNDAKKWGPPLYIPSARSKVVTPTY